MLNRRRFFDKLYAEYFTELERGSSKQIIVRYIKVLDDLFIDNIYTRKRFYFCCKKVFLAMCYCTHVTKLVTEKFTRGVFAWVVIVEFDSALTAD